MQKKSDQILKLLGGGQTLREARLKALKITKEIQGFGSSTSSPSSSSASDASAHSPFGSFSTGTPRPNNDMNDLNKFQSPTKFDAMQLSYSKDDNVHDEGKHLWDSPVVEEKGSFLDSDDETDGEKRDGFVIGIFSKLASIGPSNGNHAKVGFRSISDVGKVNKKKVDRHSSFWY
ncbi:Epsin-3 [Quillaja saponaria]|uniref:Epsin-3 n=1 Tax=Quillaja saponaria TaxID=32244 RepID=A0AAD7LAT6_QUISA|nr:Epsin-3 [Quillaja saponaria]